MALRDLGRDQLTRREQQVLQCALLGMSVRECATVLALSDSTVKNHRKAAYRKLSVRSAGELLTSLLGGFSGEDSPVANQDLRRRWFDRLNFLEQKES